MIKNVFQLLIVLQVLQFRAYVIGFKLNDSQSVQQLVYDSGKIGLFRKNQGVDIFPAQGFEFLNDSSQIINKLSLVMQNCSGVDFKHNSIILWNLSSFTIYAFKDNLKVQQILQISLYEDFIKSAGFLGNANIFMETSNNDLIILYTDELIDKKEQVFYQHYRPSISHCGNDQVRLNQSTFVLSYDIMTDQQNLTWQNDNITTNIELSIPQLSNNQSPISIFKTQPLDKLIQLSSTYGDFNCDIDRILLVEMTPIFDIILLNNQSIQFRNQYQFTQFTFNNPMKYSPYNILEIKYLFQISQNIVFIIRSNRSICFQYYKFETDFSSYNNILCMKVKDHNLSLEKVEYQAQQKSFIMLIRSENDIYIDEYQQCFLYIQTNYICNLCVKDSTHCVNNCHSLKNNECFSDQLYFKGNPFSIFLLLLAVILIVTLVITLIKAFYSIIIIVLKGLHCTLRFLFYQGPILLKDYVKKQWLKTKNCFLLHRNRARHLPLQNQVCPICLDNLNNPVYFQCQRHMACHDCMKQFQDKTPQQLQNQQNRCPYRD